MFEKIIHVKVTANASRESITCIQPEKFEISVKEKPQNNAANERVCELIAKKFKVSIRAVRIISGHRRPRKKVIVYHQS